MKRKLLILTISLLLLSVVFSACSGDKAITGIKITEGLEYTVELGGTLDTSKIVAEVTYNDNSTVTVTAADLTIGTIDTTKTGKQPLSITYKDFTITVDITVKAPEVKPAELESIAITQNFVTELFVGELFDTTKITAIATYDDGSTKTIANTELTITPIDTTTAGDKTLTVTWEGKTATATIKVKAIVLDSIRIDPTTVDYEADELDTTGIKVTAIYNNGNRAVITNSQIEFVKNDAANTLTAKWGGKEHTISLTPPVLTGIRIDSYTVKGYQGIPYVTNVTASAIYDNGGEADLPAGELKISAIDTATAGEKTLTVTCEDHNVSATAKVQIIGVKFIALDAATVNNGNKEINRNATLDTSVIKVNVTYEDDYQVLGLTAANGVTFSALNTSAVGDATLTATYLGKSASATLKVVSHEIWGVQLPEGIASYVSNQKNFTTQGAVYAVGDDNPFRFNLSLLLWDNDKGEVTVSDTAYIGTSKIYQIVGSRETLLTGNALAEWVSINENSHTFDFTEKAIGHTFRIETAPDKNNHTLVNEADCVAELTVRVVDAYNLYEAWELNLIHNSNDSTDVLYEFGDYSEHQYKVVTEFLQMKMAAELKNDPSYLDTIRNNLRGVVFHSSLRVTTNDIPAKYLVTENDSKFGTVKQFVDHFSVYYHRLDDAHPTFSMYGNYNSLYSSDLPIIVEGGKRNNNAGIDDSSSSELFRFSVQWQQRDVYGMNYSGKMDGYGNYKTNVENLRLRGDDAYDIDDRTSEKHKRSLIAFKTNLHVVDFDNVRIEKYLIAVNPDSDNQTVTIRNCKLYNGWMNHLYIWNNNSISGQYDGKSNAVGSNYYPVTVRIENSLLAKCGGPVIIADYAGDGGYGYNSVCEVNVSADKNTRIYTYVTGQEAWFNAYNVSPMATQLLALDIPIANFADSLNNGTKAHLTSIGNEDMTGINSANLIFVNRGAKGKFVHEGHGSLDMQDPTLTAWVSGGLWNGAGTKDVPPILQAGGAIAFTDGTNMYIPSGMLNPPAYPFTDARLATGTYINIFTPAPGAFGNEGIAPMGVVCGYYH